MKPKLLTTLETYSRQQFLHDSIAGATVALVALPLSIAIAIASGAPPAADLHPSICRARRPAWRCLMEAPGTFVLAILDRLTYESIPKFAARERKLTLYRNFTQR